MNASKKSEQPIRLHPIQTCPIGKWSAVECSESEYYHEDKVFALVVDSDTYEIRSHVIGAGVIPVCDEWRAKLNLYERVK